MPTALRTLVLSGLLCCAFFCTTLNTHAIEKNSTNLVPNRHEIIIKMLREEWQETGGLELLIALPSKSSLSSRFGHSSLRFVGSGNLALNDIVFELLGESNENRTVIGGIRDALTRGLLLKINFSNLKEQSYQYSQVDFNGYKRLPVPSHRALRKQLLDQIESFSKNASQDQKFKYLTNNCTSILARILLEAGFFQVSIPDIFAPSDLFEHMRTSLLSPWMEVGGIDFKLRLDENSRSIDENTLESLSTLDLQRALVFSDPKLAASVTVRQIKEELNLRSDPQSAEVVYGVEALPQFFYQLDGVVEEDIKNYLLKKFTNHDLEKMALSMQVNLANNIWIGGNTCKHIPEQCEYFLKIMTVFKKILSA